MLLFFFFSHCDYLDAFSALDFPNEITQQGHSQSGQGSRHVKDEKWMALRIWNPRGGFHEKGSKTRNATLFLTGKEKGSKNVVVAQTRPRPKLSVFVSLLSFPRSFLEWWPARLLELHGMRGV